MKKILLLVCASAFMVAANAQEMGRVISVTPVQENVPILTQECSNQQINQPVYSANPGNALIGALAGGLIGNAIDGRHHRGGTAVGAITGAVIGSQVNTHQGYVPQTVQNCYNATRYENQLSHYNVVYRHNGQTFTTQTQYRPGEYINVEEMGYRDDYMPPRAYVPAPVYRASPPPVYYAPAPVYVAPPVYRSAPIYVAPPVYIHRSPNYYREHRSPHYYRGHRHHDRHYR